MNARPLSLLLLSLALAGAAGWWWQWHRAAPQRAQLSIVRAEIERQQTQHERLVASQISEADLKALRADRAAVARLREEVNTLAQSVKAREQALTEQTAKRKIPPAPPPVPDLVLQLQWNADRGFLLGGKPMAAADLRDQVAGLAAGGMFEIRISQPKPGDRDAMRAFGDRMKSLAGMAKEIAQQQGLKMSIRFEPPE